MTDTAHKDDFDALLDPGSVHDNGEYGGNGEDCPKVLFDRAFYSFFELKRLVEEFQEIHLDAELHGNRIWSHEEKSQLIESILMNIPLPLFYFAMNRKGIISVVDGLRRINTVFDYMDDKFALARLRCLDACSGLRFSGLKRQLQAKMEKCQIQAYVLQPGVPEDVKLDIFGRVNRRGTPMNKQEMRNALYMGKSTTLLEELSNRNKTPDFARATAGRVKSDRMQDRYLILRFLSFYLWRNKGSYGLKKYGMDTEPKNSLDEFLGRYMRIMNAMPDSEMEKIRDVFVKTMQAACLLYHNRAFASEHNEGEPIHILLFESLAFMLASLGEDIDREPDATKTTIANIMSRSFFRNNMAHASMSMRELCSHFEKLEQEIKKPDHA